MYAAESTSSVSHSKLARNDQLSADPTAAPRTSGRMDVGGSFLELSCVRIALLPAGAAMRDHRFEELTSHLTSFREVPVSALPRRAAVPRATGNATFSSMPTAFREALAEASSPSPLLRSRSATKDIGRPTDDSSLSALKSSPSSPAKPDGGKRLPLISYSSTRLGDNSVSYRKTYHPPPVSPRHTTDLDMTSPEVDSSFRLRYDVVHRDQAGMLIMKPFSEWDDFHSSKIWGVFGIVDCTQPGVCDSTEKRKQAIFDAYDDFNVALSSFKDASVRRLVVFTSQDAAQESGPFVLNDPKSPSNDANAPALHFSVGYVPERAKYEETRLEVRAQIIHFAGLLLNAIDRDCWKRRESPATDLYLSPIDEKYTADRQSKLAKRRAGRLDKLLADSLLLMGSPSEALVKYNSAMEKARANSDRLWLAGAMEGWSAAHVLSHVGSGGSVNDPILSDRLIEHYGEIYKLYQKKRVAEPEAAAALRLAEFLGRWTNRRKDALEAAEHAATVGEGLRVQKRAALWEALARFSDRMGCRRKAALYLYRLGSLIASQSIWSSAVTLMIAAERQLSRDGGKPWADLNRKVLLTAAGHAEEAGDSSTAARLYVEALVIPAQSLGGRADDYEHLIKSLSKAQVPAYLPAAKDVIRLGDISALQIAGLSIHERLNVNSNEETEARSKDGPFIYNPFEAKKRAKAAAVARRAVTWVCDEPAQVSVRLHNKIGAELSVDIIAILMSPSKAEENGGMDLVETPGTAVREKPSAVDEESASANHTRAVRESLQRSDQMAKTISETITLPSHERRSGSVKHITVIPKRTGPLYVRGVLVRLFNGALVILQMAVNENGDVPPVNVICSLPRISLSSHSVDGGTMENISSRTPLTVYEGETRRFRVNIQNTGTEIITWMKARVFSSHPAALEITRHDLNNETILKNLEQHGSSKSFTVEVLGNHRSISHENEPDDDDFWKNHSSLSIVSIVLEYEGTESAGTIRESGTYVKVSSRPAISVGRVDIFEDHSNVALEGSPEGFSGYCCALEVRNDVTTPATVKVSSRPERTSSRSSDDDQTTPRSLDFSSEDCLLENGASARLITPLANNTLNGLRKRLEPRGDRGELATRKEAVYRIIWNLPALGRHGYVDVSSDDFWRALPKTQISTLSKSYDPTNLLCAKLRFVQADIKLSIAGTVQRSTDDDNLSSSLNTVKVGRFWSAQIEVLNTSEVALPSESMLDIDLVQSDEFGQTQELNRAVVVGATQRVCVGPLQALKGAFHHSVRIRVASTGIFQLQAWLYDGAETRADGDRQRLTEVGKRLRVSPFGEARRLEAADNTLAAFLADKLLVGEKRFTDVRNGSTILAAAPAQDIITSASGNRDITLETTPLAPPTPRTLKRVGIMKRKKVDDGKVVPTINIVQPTTVDSYPHTGRPRVRSTMLACGLISLSAVQDTTTSAVPGLHFAETKAFTPTAVSTHSSSELTSDTNPDTIYH